MIDSNEHYTGYDEYDMSQGGQRVASFRPEGEGWTVTSEYESTYEDVVLRYKHYERPSQETVVFTDSKLAGIRAVNSSK